MQGEEKAPKPDRYPMCTDQPAQIDCRRAACQYHGIGDGCTNSSPAITLKEDSYHVTCWSFKVREPHPEPASELKPCPFCGDGPFIDTKDVLLRFQVRCPSCDTGRTRWATLRADAIEAWNRRA